MPYTTCDEARVHETLMQQMKPQLEEKLYN
jgi:hypothetical protein